MATSETTPSRSSPASPPAASRSIGDRGTRFAVPALWALMPVVAGPALANALDTRSRSVQIVASVGLWLVWGAGLGLSLVPRSTSLTAIRIIIPASVMATAWALVGGSDAGLAEIVGITAALLVTIVVMLPFVGELFVNGSAYGDERRMPLRAPAGLMLGPIELAWVICIAGGCAGPLLLAAESWIAGGVTLVLGWPGAFFAARALHGLSQRWIVFVPAGLVLHDQMAIADPMMAPRRIVASIGPALADTTATDFTLGSYGLALQITLTEPVPVAPIPRRRTPGQRPALESLDVSSMLFTPTRPGALLREARARRLPVG